MAYYQPGYFPQSYSSFPVGYQPVQQPVNTQTSYAPSQTGPGWIWVDGEIGARAYQIPQGTPPGTTIPLWDTNDMLIYLKSTNAMGMPNPIQRLRYYPEEEKKQALPQGQSGDDKPEKEATHVDESRFVTKEEFEKMKHEIEDMLTTPTKKRGE